MIAAIRAFIGTVAAVLAVPVVIIAADPPRAETWPPLVDAPALAAHADSAGIPRAAAYSLAWMESRDGRRGNDVLGPGRVVVDSVVWTGTTSTVYKHRICREVGRMQINPCAGLQRGNPRCAYRRVRDNIEDNYACGMWYFSMLAGDARQRFSRYNGGNPEYARAALAQTGEWWFNGFLREGDRM